MTIRIYTDGSFRDDTIAWAFVAVQKNEVVHQDNGVIKNPKPDLIKIQNVGAELKAVMLAVCWAMGEGHQQVVICHDYVGVSKWVQRKWRAKNFYTQQYTRWMTKVNITIHFRHVKGHSGNQFNELADKLAKEALDYV